MFTIRKIMIVLSVVLVTWQLSPSINVLASSYSLDAEILDDVNVVLEKNELSVDKMEELYDITQKAMIINSDGTYSFDSDIAIKLGATPEQANNLKNGYENISFEEVNSLFGEEVEVAPAAAVIALPVLINALLAMGMAWLVTEILNLGAYQACKKWKNSAKAPKIFKTFCNAKGW